MNWVYVHLLLNHVPIVLAGLGVIAIVAAVVSRKRIVWVYALTTLTLAGLSVYPVYFSGSQAEHPVVEHDRNARKSIHEHEDAADWALWMVLATGAVSAYGLYLLRKNPNAALPVWFRALVVIASLFAISTVVRTSMEGGKIRHEDWERSLTTLPPPPKT